MTFEQFFNKTFKSKFLGFGLGITLISVIIANINQYLWLLHLKEEFNAGNFPFETWNYIILGTMSFGVICMIYGAIFERNKNNHHP